MSRSYSRFLPALMLVLILAAAAYAFAAANVVPESGAGDGSATISGYTITNVHYTLNGTNPANIASVQFDVAPTAGAGAAQSVSVQLDGGTWSTCSLVSGNSWTCSLTGVTAAAAANLHVVAAQ